MTYPVTVSHLSTTTSEKSLQEFFSFCGKIASIHHDAGANMATVTFEKQQAARTALMLNGGTLDGATIAVASDTVSDEHHDDTNAYAPGSATEADQAGYEQHDKPRAGIVAELLAKGYIVSEQVVNRAIDIDQKQGISSRFLSYIKSLDSTVGQKIGGPDTTVSGKAKEVVAQGHAQAKSIDEQHGITKQAGDYYSRALSSPFGQRVYAFYTQATKQVIDVHEEAKRIAASEKEKAGTATGTDTGYTAAGSTTIPATTETAPPPSVPGGGY